MPFIYGSSNYHEVSTVVTGIVVAILCGVVFCGLWKLRQIRKGATANPIVVSPSVVTPVRTEVVINPPKRTCNKKVQVQLSPGIENSY